MVRLIRHDRNRPYLIKTRPGESVYVRACGLSRNKPNCDGSHKRTLDEEQNETYVYDDDARIKLVSFFQPVARQE